MFSESKPDGPLKEAQVIEAIHYVAGCAEEWSKPEPNLQYLDEIAARFGQESHS
jgi:hypothetical protein